MGKNNDDWQDVPLEAAEDDWEDVPVERPRPRAAIGESVMQGAAKGISLGTIDEITAAAGAAKDSIEGSLGLRGDITFAEAYPTWRDNIREHDKQVEEDNPEAYMGAQIGGGIAASLVPGVGALNSAKAANAVGGTVGKLAPAAVRLMGKEGVGRTALMAGEGGIMGGGLSEANPFESPDQLGEFAGDVGLGAVTGAATQGTMSAAAPVVSRGAKALPGALKNAAERRAFKAAVGNQGKIYDDAVAKGRVNKIGRDLLDDEIVTFGSSARTISERAGDQTEKAWQGMKSLMDDLDAKGAHVDMAPAAQKLRDYAAEVGGSGNKALTKRLLDAADDLDGLGKTSFEKAQVEKNSWQHTPGDPQSVSKEVANRVKSIIGETMEEAVEGSRAITDTVATSNQTRSKMSNLVNLFEGDRLADLPPSQFGEVLKTGSGASFTRPGQAVLREVEQAPEAGLTGEQSRQLYQGLKKKYGSFASTENAAERLANRQEKNGTFSLTDKILAAGQIAANPFESAGGLAKAAITAGGSKMLRERGSSMAAVSMDKLADVLKQAPQTFGKFAPALQKASARGGHSLGVTHFLLMNQDPEYRKLVGLDDE